MDASGIMLAIPTRGSVRYETIIWLEQIRADNPGLGPTVFQPGAVSVSQNRNRIVQHFLKSDCRFLAMVDDDIVPPPHFFDLVHYLEKDKRWGMLCVPHPIATNGGAGGIDFSIYQECPEGARYVAPQHGIHEADLVATGAVIVPRRVFDRVGDAPFRVIDDPRSATLTGEDFLFCQDLRRHGFRVGYMFDGWYCNHNTTVGLAPLKEAMTEE